DIPFDPNQVGPSFAEEGSYSFVSEHFTVTNLDETAIFTLDAIPENLPENWMLTWCHELDGSTACHFAEWEFEFPAQAELILDATIMVNSTGSVDYSFIFNSESLSESVSVDFSFATADAVSNGNNTTPSAFKLNNYPNPFNPQTKIAYSSGNQPARLIVYNLKGQIVKDFGLLPAGNNYVVWNGKDNSDNFVPSGIYFSKLQIRDKVITNKMVLLK
ncbi:MAG: T9SS type A sorting domain-containing protein, partial [Candidatus Cloacimonadota bacterium]|nr:T9SS type A sorting domain-containing protein [Candidatus Cloacimonadota bacterium]